LKVTHSICPGAIVSLPAFRDEGLGFRIYGFRFRVESGQLTIHKLTSWVGGTNPPTLKRGGARGGEPGDPKQVGQLSRKVDVRLPGKGDSNSHGTRPVHLIITMI